MLHLVGEKYIYEILRSLSESPKRYTDLKQVCSSDRTLTRKLQNLQDAGLVDTEMGKKGRKAVINYRLTDRGRAVFSKADGLVRQEQEPL